MVERRLGRGLDFFLSGSRGEASPPPAAAAGGPTASPFPGSDVQQIEVGRLQAGKGQPRTEFAEAELEELAHSIRASGVLQPILVRPVDGGEKFEIIAGERRWRASQRVGLERIPALVREVNDEQAAVFALVENVQRTDLNAIEKAQAFRKIQELTQASQEEVARQVGLNRSSVANFVRLLDLPEPVQSHVSRGTLSMGHARALLGLKSGKEQMTVADEIVRQELSVRQVEELVRGVADATKPKDGSTPKKKKGERPIWVKELEDNLAEALAAQVTVRYGKKRSKIQIECIGREDFERVYEALKSLGEGEPD